MAKKKKSKKTSRLRQPIDDSIGAWICSFYRAGDSPTCPYWPPDLFAIAGSLLRRTGAYRQVFETPAGAVTKKGYSQLAIWREARAIGAKWREGINRELQKSDALLTRCIPGEVSGWWGVLAGSMDVRLEDFSSSYSGPRKSPPKKGEYKARDPVEAAMCLTLAADQACDSIGVRRYDPDKDEDRFLWLAQQQLESDQNTFGSFCMQISRQRVAVLPKYHTPQTGLTFRSLSHHLALGAGGEIDARWYGPFVPPGWTNHLNVLLLPWPTEIQAKDFRLVSMPTHADAEHYQAFEFAPREVKSGNKFGPWFRRALARAQALGGPVHAVILPEAAVNLTEYALAERAAVRAGMMLIAGVRLSGSDTNLQVPSNACVIQIGGLFGVKSTTWTALLKTRFVQGKHHRWRLDRNQVLQYELGTQLPASGIYWENIGLPGRSLLFVSLSDWMTWCALVCEDLARQEPAAEVVRAVGPNLVVALLMDGPQLKERWSARYASVLADDPGSSVLALSNLGMVKRSRPLENIQDQRKDSVIALWRDIVGGSRELSVPEGHDACILSLVAHREREFSVDGSRDSRPGRYPIYAGHTSFKV